MKLIAGLGNPGSEYRYTRHNIGFRVVEHLADLIDIKIDHSKYNGLFGKGSVQGESVILVKPLTYMNLSGEAIRPLMQFFKIDIKDLIVVYDDMDLVVGKVRLRPKGSAGGHNGMKSIIHHVGSEDFKRVRVGIGRPVGKEPVIDFVLRPFAEEDRPVMKESVEKAALALKAAIVEPFENVMNQFN